MSETNCDGERSIADAVLLTRIIAEDTTANIPHSGLNNADLDSSGIWDLLDMRAACTARRA